MKTGLPRREFLKRGAAVAGLISTAGSLPGSILGVARASSPNDRVQVGLIGVGVMGSGHLRRLAGDPAFQLVAVCEVDTVRRDRARESVHAIYAAERASGTFQGCTAYNDFRELLARPDIDAVVVVTPDHWHALLAVEAAKAGKDVYLEKPVSMTIEEGRRLADVVHRYECVFQTGTQYRSIPGIRRVCQFVREGGLGRVKSVFALYNTLGGWLRSQRFRPYANVVDPNTMGRSYVPLDFALPAEPVPEGLDWDLWVGPAAWHPYNPLYHTNPSPGVVPWCFCEDFGVTSLTWHLAHSADVIQYALGTERTGPVEIIHPNSHEYPTLTCRYENGTLLHFVDGWETVKNAYGAVPPDARLAGNFGGLFVGERGWLTSMTTGGRLEGGPEELWPELGLRSREVNPGANDHHANWLKCIRTRERPSSDEEIGHRSASLGHLANIACWTGQSLRWDPNQETFLGNDFANRLRSRAKRAPWCL